MLLHLKSILKICIKSKIFNNVGRAIDDHHITEFICDYFRMITMNFDDPHQMEDVMLKDLEKHHHEESEGAHALSVVGDAFPAWVLLRRCLV